MAWKRPVLIETSRMGFNIDQAINGLFSSPEPKAHKVSL